MNLFDYEVKTDDDSLLQVKSLDQDGLQKFVNMVDSIRALMFLSKTNWYYSNALEHGDSNELVCQFQDTIESLRVFFKLEFLEITSRHVTEVLKCVLKLREMTEFRIENSTNASTVWTTELEFCRQVLPLVIALEDSLTAVYEESLKNVVPTLDLEAFELVKDSSECYDEDYHLENIRQTAVKMNDAICQEPGTAKALMGKNLLELLTYAAKFFNSRGQRLTKELKVAKIK